MNRYLLISSSEKVRDYLSEFVSSQEEAHIDTTFTASQARRLLIERDYDIVMINVPLKDESGIELSLDISERSSVLLLVKAEFADQVQERVESSGVFVVEKPIIKQVLYSALRFLWASRRKMEHLLERQGMLNQQLEDAKIINRAKCCLIEYLGMTEPQAHRHIEKQAMDMRRNKRSVAEDILKTYEM